MIKLLITATSFALGGAGGALVYYLGANPLAFTHVERELPAVTAIHPVTAAPVAVERPRNEIVLPEIRITASQAKPKQTLVPVGFGPCTGWNDVGAVFIEPTGATGVRRVRDLCAKPSGER